MDKCNWKIIYAFYSGPEKRAVDLIYKEMGFYLLREKGEYSFRSMSCEKVGCMLDKNAVVIGTHANNALLRRYISREEIPTGGYVVKVIDYPEQPDIKLALICGDSEVEVFYGAVDFVDDYFAYAIPVHDNMHLAHELFLEKLPDYYVSTAPCIKTRSVFTWGHPINDYRAYIDDLARMRLNQLIIWNDYLPINANEVVDYAHSYGIKVIWGFAWGWSTDCALADLKNLEQLKDKIIKTYRDTYANSGGDGIYFQSFTELLKDEINGMRISKAVTYLVNITARELLDEYPDLHIQFGLHATSVKAHLEDIACVDSRVEILWEDCGSFPYKQLSAISGKAEYDNTCNYEENIAFTDKMIHLRKNGGLGLLYKCQVTMDWSRHRFVHQPGPYVMGNMSEFVRREDKAIIRPIWRFFQAEWIENGKYAYDLTRHIYKETKGDITMCLAGTFIEGDWFPTALSAQMFWNCQEPYEALVKRVMLRHSVTMA